LRGPNSPTYLSSDEKEKGFNTSGPGAALTRKASLKISNQIVIEK